MTSVATYIAFPGNAKEAFEHYKDVLGGELHLMTYGTTQMEGMPFTPPADAVAHAELHTPGGIIAGADAMEEVPVKDTAYSMLLTVDTVEEGRALIEKFLAGGGSMNLPFELAPWGQYYGQVFDRFGVMWSLSVPPTA
ncbi:VOC family protein [Kribbia dieselivorans]|uniref:VOC family protein n=1 Tax=Kribbia dieselivorans TaxID=331526 RepID=UPI000838B8AB|nr:glyoxalase/bleomycin resistance/extradiol dioxygenase family protein [Kribbia dieselivorans]